VRAISLAAALLGPSLAAESPAEDPVPAGAASVTAELRIVLLVPTHGEEAARADAIAAHLSGLPVEVAVVQIEALGGELSTKHAEAERIATVHDAAAVLWVESPRTGTLELQLVRPGRREVLHRAVSTDPDAPEAGLEALGVVARSVTAALLADHPIEMEVIALPDEPKPAAPATVEPLPPAPAPAPAPARTRGRARIALGYVGTSYAREIAWQSGVDFAAAWVWPFGLHVGAGYGLMQRARADAGSAAIEVTRHPISATVGYGHRWRSLFFEGEAVAILDYATRSGSTTAGELAPARDRGHTTFALGPRGRLAVVAAWRVEVYVQVGMEVWLGRIRYAVQTPEGATAVVLQPRRVRAHTGAGIAVRL
jgi:hypothetical protein